MQKTEKRQTVTDEQRDMALRILATAMAIMRDDQPFDPAHTIFGRNFAVNLRRGSMSTEYSFENPAFPRAYITLSVVADPTDYTADRRKVKRVPTEFTVWFSPLMKGITRSMLEDLFPLDIGYWVDGNGNRRPGNDMGAIPPQVLLHHYRYRASNQPASRFPVDVQLAFGDPDPQATDGDAPKTPVLLGVLLTRDYSELIPKQR
ncbi:hypothetical protein [Paraburkholderia susongensis]|uniref:hypothetical protein n=1 Tax=Paraburkholderia susongensis TaxID=1515439 RepID=UPI001FC9E3FE|nr:hypothetical protein [Paraburkholderia susongensis]